MEKNRLTLRLPRIRSSEGKSRLSGGEIEKLAENGGQKKGRICCKNRKWGSQVRIEVKKKNINIYRSKHNRVNDARKRGTKKEGNKIKPHLKDGGAHSNVRRKAGRF